MQGERQRIAEAPRRLPRRGWHARARAAWMAAVSGALTATSALLARALCVGVGCTIVMANF